MRGRVSRGLVPLACVSLLVLGAAALPADDPPRFSDWSTAVSLGAVVNSGDKTDSGAFISKDGLKLYFGSNGREGAFGGFDLYVSSRADVGAPWGPPKNLGPAINTAGNEQTPALSQDGLRLYFASDRPDPQRVGDMDLYVARRQDVRDDSNWSAPVNLGSAVNSAAVETGPTLLEDQANGTAVLFFNSTRPGLGFEDIYSSAILRDGVLGPAQLVRELSTASRDVRPAIRKDGLELFLDSNRPGTEGPLDIWVSTRASTRAQWSDPARLGPAVNSPSLDARPAISFDGTELYFHSTREGKGDIFRSTRTRIDGSVGD